MRARSAAYPDQLEDTDAFGKALRAEFSRALERITGRWKLSILWLLYKRKHRFGELRRGLPGITQHTLTMQLRELEADGMLTRTVFPEVPLRVEYEISSAARDLKPIFSAILQWARAHPAPSVRAKPGLSAKDVDRAAAPLTPIAPS